MVILLSFVIIVWMVWGAITSRPEDRPQSAFIPVAEQIRVERLLKKHGLIGRVAIVEIEADGSLWFERHDGRRCELK